MVVNMNDLREFDMELARCVVFRSMVVGDQGMGGRRLVVTHDPRPSCLPNTRPPALLNHYPPTTTITTTTTGAC